MVCDACRKCSNYCDDFRGWLLEELFVSVLTFSKTFDDFVRYFNQNFPQVKPPNPTEPQSLIPKPYPLDELLFSDQPWTVKCRPPEQDLDHISDCHFKPTPFFSL